MVGWEMEAAVKSVPLMKAKRHEQSIGIHLQKMQSLGSENVAASLLSKEPYQPGLARNWLMNSFTTAVLESPVRARETW